MKPALLPSPTVNHRLRSTRGSVLIVAMLMAAIIGISLVSYIQLCTNSLKLAHRTFFADSANNLVEAGLEEAVYSFNQMGSGTGAATVWSTANGWATNTSTNTATRTLTFNNLDQNANGAVKIYVSGFDGTDSAPFVVSQATITPYDGAPIVKITQVKLAFNGPFANGVVAKNGITWNGHPMADSWNSGAATNPSGPFTTYAAGTHNAHNTVADLTGTVSLGAQGVVNGDLALGSAVTYSGTVNGKISNNFSYKFAMPAYPTAASLDHYTNLVGATPTTLPATLDLPNSSDGRYYYFISGGAVTTTTIAASKNVTIVGSSNTSVTGTVTIPATGTLKIYTDGTVNGTYLNNAWAGALQIYTSTTSGTTISGNANIMACIYAPNSPITGNGGGNSGAFYGSFIGASVTSNGHMDFHYDESLKTIASGKPWILKEWREFQTTSERTTYTTQLNF